VDLSATLGRFGHEGFRPGQEDVVRAILEHRETLAVMPTGSGKSLCYQLPAVVLPGTAVVVSPLVALIRDQVRSLLAKGMRAASLTGHDGAEEKRATLVELARGKLDLIYVAPERFRSPAFVEALGATRLCLFAVDEAHCISQWGHDFRPDYARLGELIAQLGPERVAALTATATPDVRNDIVRQLGLRDPQVIVTGFDRPNLVLSVEAAKKGREKLERVAATLVERTGDGGAAIVYVATRKTAQKVATALAERGFDAHPYHAGMSGPERSRVERHFSDADRPVVVATTAFGMGIDRGDVRAVVHYQIPASPEAYYQEVGRAGRDGKPAHGVLIYDQADLRHAFAKHEASCPRPAAVATTLAIVAAEADTQRDFDEWVSRVEADVGPSARAALVALEQAQDLRLSPAGAHVWTESPSIDPASLEERARRERVRLDAMVGYVTRAACRRRYLVDYFGDTRRPEQCGTCDRCRGPAPRELEGPELEAAWMALSCIARMRGRWGKAKVVDVLLGSRAQPIRDAGLDQLSTHGLLQKWSRQRVLSLLDALVAAELAQIAGTDYPKLMLTEAGVRTLKSRAPVRLRLEPRAETRTDRSQVHSAAPELDGADAELFERLRTWRAHLAAQLGKPPYVIAHDRALAAVCAARPESPSELLGVPGFGPTKVERYGEALLGIVRGTQS
jgi:ATP-dependent DNA helicase RecQ